METVTIKIEGRHNLSFFLELLRKLPFVVNHKVSSPDSDHPKSVEDAGIEWAVKEPSINDFAGIWERRKITLEELRDRAWKRN